jgi:hypothetical protein
MYTTVCLNMFQQCYVFPLYSVEVKIIFFWCVCVCVCKDICHCYFLINWLTLWSSLSGEANSFSVINEFDVSYGNQKFMTKFTGNHPWFLLHFVWIQSRLLHEVCILILSCFSNTLVFQVVLSSDFFTKILCAFLITPMRATCSILTCVFNLTEKWWIKLFFEVYYIYSLVVSVNLGH